MNSTIPTLYRAAVRNGGLTSAAGTLDQAVRDLRWYRDNGRHDAYVARDSDGAPVCWRCGQGASVLPQTTGGLQWVKATQEPHAPDCWYYEE